MIIDKVFYFIVKNFRVGNYWFSALHDLERMSTFVKDRIVHKITRTVEERGNFLLALSGGQTPKLLYEMLNEDERVDWSKVYVIQVDERWVPIDHEESNARMIQNALTKMENFLPVPRDRSPDFAATMYNNQLTDLFNRLERISYDLAILGMGEDTHTASLFPESFELDYEEFVKALRVEKLDAFRISLTPKTLQNGKENYVMFTGKAKAEAFMNAHGVINPFQHPIVLMPEEKTRFIIDYEAAEVITKQ